MNAVMGLCTFCESHGPRVVMTTQPYRSLEEEGGEKRLFYGRYDLLEAARAFLRDAVTSGPADVWDTCAACSSAPNPAAPLFLTNHHPARTSFVGSQYPFHPDVLHLLRNAALRSLSHELCPQGDGPVFFGDDHHGYTLSYAFSLRDCRARGFHHLYSLVLVSMDKLLLLNFYDVLVGVLEQMAGRLQKAAATVFEREQLELGKEGGLGLAAATRAGMLPSGFLRQRVGSAPSRPLSDLTGDPNIFRSLHRTFTWLLSRDLPLREAELVGWASQDELCRLEEAEGGLPLCLSDEDDDGSLRVQRPPFFVLGAAPSSPEQLAPFQDLQSLASSLLPANLRRLLHSTLIGDQIILRCSDRDVQKRVLNALAVLLPYGCARIVYYAPRYQPSWLCNFLGLDESCEVPEDATELQKAGQLLELRLRLKEDGERGELCDWDCEVATEGSEVGPPRLVERVEELLWETGLGAEGLGRLVGVAKEEWERKAQTQWEVAREQAGLEQSALAAAVAELTGATAADGPLLHFWQGGLSREYRASFLSSTAAASNAASKKSSDASGASILSD